MQCYQYIICKKHFFTAFPATDEQLTNNPESRKKIYTILRFRRYPKYLRAEYKNISLWRYHMKRYNNLPVVGIDHGYGNIKTANTVTPTGITKLDAAPTFTKNTLYYDGSYYLIGEGCGSPVETSAEGRSTDRGDSRDRRRCPISERHDRIEYACRYRQRYGQYHFCQQPQANHHTELHRENG